MNRTYLLTNVLAAAGIAATIIGGGAEPFARNCIRNLESHAVCRGALRVWIAIDGPETVEREFLAEGMTAIIKRMAQ